MKILIPYDGTRAAENALIELQNGNFGQDDEILVVITDVFLPDTPEEFFESCRTRLLNLGKSGISSYAPARRRIEEEKLLEREIRSRSSTDFSTLNIKIVTLPGKSLVSNEILRKAAVWKADLIILGSQELENDAVNNGYKSGSWRVAAHAECSVQLGEVIIFGTSSVKPDDVLNDEKEISSENRSERQETSNDTAEMSKRQPKCSNGIIPSAEKSERITKLVSRQKRIQPPHEIRTTAAVASLPLKTLIQ